MRKPPAHRSVVCAADATGATMEADAEETECSLRLEFPAKAGIPPMHRASESKISNRVAVRVLTILACSKILYIFFYCIV